MAWLNKLAFVSVMILSFHLGGFAQGTPKGARLKAVYVNGKWGYADGRGKIVIAAEYDAARPFTDGLAQVGLVDEEWPEIKARPNLRWGYIDERGRVRVALRYNVLRGFVENLAAAAVLDTKKPERRDFGSEGDQLNLKWGYVDREGREVIPLQFLAAGDFSEGLAHVNAGRAGESGGSLCGSPPNYGYIDKTGTFIIKPQFAIAANFQNGRARVGVGQYRYQGRCLCCAPRFFGQHGFVDRSGMFVLDKSTDGDATREIEDREN